MYENLTDRLRRYSEGCVAYKLDADFADAVQQAIEVLSKMEKTTRWIPVTERLPRMWEEVMLRFPNNQAVGFHDGDSGWAVFSGDNMYTYVAPEEVHPTHWKPKEES